MNVALLTIFVLAYAAIAFEHTLRINKSASALLAAGLLWTVYALASDAPGRVNTELGESLLGTAQIVFFLMGAMAIVEVVDAHDGFALITGCIRTSRLSSLLWLLGFGTFFLSAILDNLTTTIVMLSLLRKLVDSPQDRRLLAGNVVLAANAGGAWSPIGDVTTTMLWIGGQITSLAIIKGTFLASLVNMLVPLSLSVYNLRGRPFRVPDRGERSLPRTAAGFEGKLMFAAGLGILVSIPAFKTVTHLPPFLGILFGLGILWLIGDLLHRKKPPETRQTLTLAHALGRIDLSSLVFFIGILLSIATLEHSRILALLSAQLETWVGRQDLIVLLIGLVSAVVDNVPLVAASMAMYDLAQYPPDAFLWEFLAYCAGTGGSILVIGSAAGVTAMGMENLSFFWYLRRIGALALLGYGAGAAVYLLQYRWLH